MNSAMISLIKRLNCLYVYMSKLSVKPPNIYLAQESHERLDIDTSHASVEVLGDQLILSDTDPC